jgi:hypothetical protein
VTLAPMESMRRIAKRVGQCLSLVAALALSTGCAGTMTDRLQKARTSAYVYHHSAPDVEATVRQLLKDRGFEVLAADRPGIVRTEWRSILADEQFATEYERYIVVVDRLTSQHCRVAAMRVSLATLGMETAHPQAVSSGKDQNINTANYGKGTSPLLIGAPNARRDLDFEWKVIQSEEPERARVVESQISWQLAHR